MRKILPMLLLIGFASNAQLREKGTIEIIPQIGYSSFFVRDDGSSTASSLNSVNFGVLGDFYSSEKSSFRTGLLYQTMGSVSSGETDKLKYLNIPLNANLHFGNKKELSLNFGLTVGFLMSAKAEGVPLPDISGPGGVGTVDIKDMVQNAQLGLSAGLGYKLEITNNFGLLLDYQWFYGVTNASRISESSFKNSGWTINVGGVFRLK